MRSYLLPCMLSIFSFHSLSAQEANKYTGLFTNKDIALTISVKKSGEKYEGYFEVQKQRCAFTGKMELGVLSASYSYEGKTVPFTLSLLFGTYYLTTEGFNLEVQRNPAGLPASAAENTDERISQGSPKREPDAVLPAKGKRIADPYGGYSFQLPPGWVSREEQGSFLITKEGEELGISVAAHNYKSKEEILKTAEDIVDPSTNTHIRTTASEYGANGVFFHLEGRSNGQNLVLEIIARVSPYGGGVVFLTGGVAENYSGAHTELLKSMANSAQFNKPAISTAAQQWSGRLKGKQLIYLNTSGGGSEKITLNLFANGDFNYANNSSYLSGGSSVLSYAGRDSNSGTWKIQNRGEVTVLVLYGNDRSIREYVLSPRQEAGEINLDNRRYFIRTLN
jgi:hypothetical protein